MTLRDGNPYLYVYIYLYHISTLFSYFVTFFFFLLLLKLFNSKIGWLLWFGSVWNGFFRWKMYAMLLNQQKNVIDGTWNEMFGMSQRKKNGKWERLWFKWLQHRKFSIQFMSFKSFDGAFIHFIFSVFFFGVCIICIHDVAWC